MSNFHQQHIDATDKLEAAARDMERIIYESSSLPLRSDIAPALEALHGAIAASRFRRRLDNRYGR